MQSGRAFSEVGNKLDYSVIGLFENRKNMNHDYFGHNCNHISA